MDIGAQGIWKALLLGKGRKPEGWDGGCDPMRQWLFPLSSLIFVDCKREKGKEKKKEIEEGKLPHESGVQTYLAASEYRSKHRKTAA